MNIHTLVESAQNLKDPRRPYGYLQHKLESIVVICLCATISGAEDFEDIGQFGIARRDWLGKFLDLSNGIPDSAYPPRSSGQLPARPRAARSRRAGEMPLQLAGTTRLQGQNREHRW
jgi:hypothetical protein